MKNLVIDRSKWRAGGDGPDTQVGKGLTCLLNNDGFMCCLGFAALATGVVSEEEIINVGEPYEIDKEVPDLTYIGEDGCWNEILSHDAMEINDSRVLSAEEREERLIALFAEHGIQLSFEGEYYKP